MTYTLHTPRDEPKMFYLSASMLTSVQSPLTTAREMAVEGCSYSFALS